MADSEAETQPLQNGNSVLTEEEEERLKQRPADIDADVREMERRKRVEALMSSKLFREELERVLDQQMHEGGDAPLLQRIREMVGGRLNSGSFKGPNCVLPINDIRGIEGVGYEKGEKILRCKLAALYRLVDLFGWTQTGTHGQITGRLNTSEESVLTTPRGLLPHEVTASSLVKVDMQGQVQDQGTTNLPINVEGFSLHAAVHAARPDIRCVLHVRAPSVLAVSATKRGVLPLSEEACLLGEVAYHAMPFGIPDSAERDRLVRVLGPARKVLLLNGQGAVCCGACVEEAFLLARSLVAACDVQLKLGYVPLEELELIEPQRAQKIFEASRKPPAEATKWRIGGEEFEALMRMLDNAGFRTGYIYRHPIIKNEVPKPKNDVEVPPAVSSLGYLLEEEELYRQGLWKKGHGKAGERTRWLNSPNVYQKVEILETGTNDPKKITKWVDANNEEWVQDGSPKHSSTPVKIDTLQFVPKNTNPKEFKKLQQQIKDNRRADKISAGPQSSILDGVTWDEANKMLTEDAHSTHAADHVVLMGAASKGIIQRGYQHVATVYSAPYAKNPFENVSDTDLNNYTNTVHRKQRGDYDTDLSESEAISAAQITSPASAPSETEEESRDEHRVLRIETKQVPVRSQPEVVLSDVDSTDNFLNLERAHADRTKGTKLTQEAKTKFETLSVLNLLKLNKHEYSRAQNFDTIVKKYETVEKSKRNHPKCKVSLNSRLGNETVKDNTLAMYNTDHLSSRSSLYSIPSIEWDGRCKSDYAFCTRSLPRSKNSAENMYRTRSHSGFLNSFVKDPEPNHFHVPKCRGCSTMSSSYTCQSLDRKSYRNKAKSSIFLSVDNIHLKCLEECRKEFKVKVEEKVVPVYKVEQESEFVESQEFNEDNYLGDLASSFSTDNQTVIEKQCAAVNTKHSVGRDNLEIAQVTVDVINNIDGPIYRAELVQVDDVNNEPLDSTEGEYHSFTEDIDFEEAAYESPIKDLVEKDIRDYSVPINCYYEDYSKTNEYSPKKSPTKRREVTLSKANVLEPILEESKSSVGEDSNHSEEKINTSDLVQNLVEELVDKTVHVAVIQSDLRVVSPNKITTDVLEIECDLNKVDIILEEEVSDRLATEIDSISNINVQTAIKAYLDKDTDIGEEEILDCVYENVIDILSSDAGKISDKCFEDIAKSRTSAIEFSSLSGIASFDSTAEFEKYEVISDILCYLMNRIDFANDYNNILLNAKENKCNEIEFNKEHNFDEHIHDNKNEDSEDSTVYKTEIVNYTVSTCSEQDVSITEEFSIVKIIDDMEKINLNETILTESSETETTIHNRIVEGIIYYIFNKAYVAIAEKDKKRNAKNQNKKVVTVVDFENILYTATLSWLKNDSTVTESDSLEITNKSHLDKCNSECSNLENCLNCDNHVENDFHETTNEHNLLENVKLDFKKKHSFIPDHDDDEGIYSAEHMDPVEVLEQNDDEYENSTDTFTIEQVALNESFKVDRDETLEIASDLISDALDRSVVEVECSTACYDEELPSVSITTNTFVVDETDKEHMNTAFVEDSANDEYVSRSSSPNKTNSIFATCTESPIRNSGEFFIGQDLVLYEKDDTILGSPFVKKAPVISMSQTEHSGGIKYWVSFDESLKEFIEVPKRKSLRKFEENKVPSFVPLNVDDNFENSDVIYDKVKRRSSVLLEEYANDNNENYNSSLTEYNTCESEQIDSRLDDTESLQKRLLYDTRSDVHRVRKSWKYNSWPPFDDTLFYKIISKFRMSESFDPSDLENTQADSSL